MLCGPSQGSSVHGGENHVSQGKNLDIVLISEDESATWGVEPFPALNWDTGRPSLERIRESNLRHLDCFIRA